MTNQNLQIIKQFAKTDFKLRYNGSVLGYAWSLLKPLMIFTILNFVFSHIFGQTDPYYSLKLITSLMVWNFFSEGTMTGLNSIIAKAGILTKIKLPKWTIVVASTTHICITFLMNLVVLSIFYIYYNYYPSPLQIVALLFYSLCTYILILGISLITSVLFVKFRDLNQIWEVLLMGGFYASPIIYPMKAIPDYLHWILQLNPMTFIIQYIQESMFNNFTNFSISANLIYLSVLIIGFCFAVYFFKVNSKNLVEKI